MAERIPATRKHIVLAALFSLLFFTPLFLVPFFPETPVLESSSRNGIGILFLAVCAGCISGVTTFQCNQSLQKK